MSGTLGEEDKVLNQLAMKYTTALLIHAGAEKELMDAAAQLVAELKKVANTKGLTEEERLLLKHAQGPGKNCRDTRTFYAHIVLELWKSKYSSSTLTVTLVKEFGVAVLRAFQPAEIVRNIELEKEGAKLGWKDIIKQVKDKLDAKIDMTANGEGKEGLSMDQLEVAMPEGGEGDGADDDDDKEEVSAARSKRPKHLKREKGTGQEKKQKSSLKKPKPNPTGPLPRFLNFGVSATLAQEILLYLYDTKPTIVRFLGGGKQETVLEAVLGPRPSQIVKGLDMYMHFDSGTGQQVLDEQNQVITVVEEAPQFLIVKMRELLSRNEIRARLETLVMQIIVRRESQGWHWDKNNIKSLMAFPLCQRGGYLQIEEEPGQKWDRAYFWDGATKLRHQGVVEEGLRAVLVLRSYSNYPLVPLNANLSRLRRRRFDLCEAVSKHVWENLMEPANKAVRDVLVSWVESFSTIMAPPTRRDLEVPKFKFLPANDFSRVFPGLKQDGLIPNYYMFPGCDFDRVYESGLHRSYSIFYGNDECGLQSVKPREYPKLVGKCAEHKHIHKIVENIHCPLCGLFFFPLVRADNKSEEPSMLKNVPKWVKTLKERTEGDKGCLLFLPSKEAASVICRWVDIDSLRVHEDGKLLILHLQN
jgi:hypothetical protein